MSQTKTILIIEDHEESRSLYGEILRYENYAVVEKEDGKEALEYLAANPSPELIIMDLTFPYMTAAEFVHQLEANKEWAAIPRLVISGKPDIEQQTRSLKAKDFMKKPFDIDPFLNLIKKYC